MKEMLVNHTNKGETSMKKTLLIVVLAMALMLALGATPAFAKYAGYNSSKQYVPWVEARSLASQNADAALMDFGPHKGYATTTIKCAVCHSVHRGGSKLLNEGSTCAYCHTNTYYGGGAVASNLISWNASTGPHSNFCSTGAGEACHGGPHGVGASDYASAASKLLETDDVRLADQATANGLTITTATPYNAQTRVLATDATCFRCHTNSQFGVVTAGASMDTTIGTSKPSVTGHRVIAAATTSWNANGTDFPTVKTGLTIAYAPVNYCSDCHDLVDDNNGGKAAFPHSINGVVDAAVGMDGTFRPAVWLTAGAYAGAARTAVSPYNTYTGNATHAAGGGIIDGVCLKCHRGSATTGIGFTY